MNITDAIRQRARERPDAEAVIRPSGRPVSFREFDRMIDYVAKGVRELGLRPGAMVGVRSSRPYRDLCCRLALARVGIAVAARALPIHNLTACLTDETIPEADRAKFVRIESVWSEDIPATREIAEVASHPDGSAIFSVFATSGTTGSPKYVAMSHDLMAWRIAADVVAAEKSGPVRLICSIGPGTSYGFRSRLVALQNGGTVIMTVRVEGMLQAIIQHRVNHLTMAPFSLDRMVRALPADTPPPPSLKQIEVGGSALPARVYEHAVKRLCANIVSAYGAMETGFVASGPLATLRERPGAVGFIDSRVEVEAVDADEHPLPIGSEGTLRMRSPGCAREYVGNPEASTHVFRDGWVYPGDVGMVASDRMLIVTGRASEVINQGGIKVNPQAIEDVLLSVDEIAEAAAFGVPDAMGIMRIWAAIVPTGPVDMVAVNALCRERLRANAPTDFLQLTELPRNENGKVLREQLRQRANESRA